MIFAAYFVPRGRDTHIDFLRLLFLVSVICPLMQTKPETLLVGSESEIKTQNFPETITMATSGNARVKASTPSEVAELFNQYFASVQGTPAPERENGQLQDSDPFLTDVILSVSEVATGPDYLPAKILRETTDVIAPSLTELFNKSLRLGCLPEDWKLANIVLVFKKYSKEQAENYRPISL